jgi:hypothetical protein
MGDRQASAFEIGRFGRPSLEEDPLNSECISASAIMEVASFVFGRRIGSWIQNPPHMMVALRRPAESKGHTNQRRLEPSRRRKAHAAPRRHSPSPCEAKARAEETKRVPSPWSIDLEMEEPLAMRVYQGLHARSILF